MKKDVDYILRYMQSETLMNSEDESMSQLLALNDLVCSVIGNRDTAVVIGVVKQVQDTLTVTPAALTQVTQLPANPDIPVSVTRTCTALGAIAPELTTTTTRFVTRPASSTHHSLGVSTPPTPTCHTASHTASEKILSLKDLSYLQRREFKIHGGQIGDQSSDITYSSLSEQIDEGVKEGFTETGVICSVLKIIKPGSFKDMLINKDEISISKIKGFLRSHLGDKASTELFQELVCKII